MYSQSYTHPFIRHLVLLVPAALNTNSSVRAARQVNLSIVLSNAKVRFPNKRVTSSADPFTRVLGEVVEGAEPVVEPVIGPVAGEVNGAGLASCSRVSISQEN